MDDTKEAEITKLFGQPDKQYGVAMLNDTGTASAEEADDLRFSIMVSPSSQGAISKANLGLTILIRDIQYSQPINPPSPRRTFFSLTFVTLRSCI